MDGLPEIRIVFDGADVEIHNDTELTYQTTVGRGGVRHLYTIEPGHMQVVGGIDANSSFAFDPELESK